MNTLRMMEKVIEKLDKSIIQSFKTKPTKILQFGEGNFLRGFFDWMVLEMNQKAGFNAGVKIVQPLPQGLGDQLRAQDGLYHVLLNGFDHDQFTAKRQLVDVVNGVIDPYGSFGEYLTEAQNEHLQFIISNTTEAGIAYDPEDRFDYQPARSFPGKLLQFLHNRYQTLPDCDPIVILPCELIDQNGTKLKAIIERYASEWQLGEYFLKWLHEKTVFCNTLVDRIVPGYPAQTAHQIWDELGVKDQLLVEGELFHLWVIEGPGWLESKLPVKQAGLNVVFTDDLAYYRTRKVRILNGLHTTMVPVGLLAGMTTVRETVEHEKLSSFLVQALNQEIMPTLAGDKEELQAYAEEIIRRFRNPAIHHELLTISLNSFAKFKTRVLPSILAYVDQHKQLPKQLLLALAALIRLYRGDAGGKVVELKDDAIVLSKLSTLWRDHHANHTHLVNEILRDQSIWDEDLTEIPELANYVATQLELIEQEGIYAAVDKLLGE
ncbi:MAG: tagaturonate reductase [Bacteroidota bacterium]